METKPSYHILNAEGILRNFNVSKKVTKEEFNKIVKLVDKDCITRFEKNEMLKNKLLDVAFEYINTHKIPGMIESQKVENGSNGGNEKQKYLITKKEFDNIKNHAKDFADYLNSEEKYNKDEMLFFIISLVDALKLKEEDFENFHKRLEDEQGFKKDEDDDDSQDEENLDNDV